MPELIEVELYRRWAERTVGRRIAEVDAPDEWYVKGGAVPDELRAELTGATVTGTGRRGKLAWLDTDERRLGLRFGMTGRLVVDGDAAIDQLEYSSTRNEPAWIRFGLRFEGGGSLWISDPRRLGGVELDPNVAAIGPDAATLRPEDLDRALGRSTTSLKARLLDQRHIGGLGNLLADEILYAAGLAPHRPAGGLDEQERSRLHQHLRRVVDELQARGGSNEGPLFPARRAGSTCPLDGAPLQRDAIGGRTAVWCPRHQR